jgi:hypothetical protein
MTSWKVDQMQCELAVAVQTHPGPEQGRGSFRYSNLGNHMSLYDSAVQRTRDSELATLDQVDRA